MAMQGGVAAIYTTLDDSTTPLQNGAATVGDSTLASHSNHVHPVLIPVNIIIDGTVPYLETIGTAPFIWIPDGHYMAWDNTNLVMVYV